MPENRTETTRDCHRDHPVRENLSSTQIRCVFYRSCQRSELPLIHVDVSWWSETRPSEGFGNRYCSLPASHQKRESRRGVRFIPQTHLPSGILRDKTISGLFY